MKLLKIIFFRSKKFLLGIARKNYELTKALNLLELQFTHPCHNQPIVIYQMGKVGSSSVYSSLKALKLDNPVYHVHFLTPQGINWAETIYKSEFPRRHRIEAHILQSIHMNWLNT